MLRRTVGTRLSRAVAVAAVAAVAATLAVTGTALAAAPAPPAPTAGTDVVEDPFATGEEVPGPGSDLPEEPGGDLPDSLLGAAAALPELRPAGPFSGPPEEPARYVGQWSCDPVARPGVVALRNAALATYGTGYDGGIVRACSVGGRSEHKEGRAWDWMLRASNGSQRAVADTFLAWLVGKDGTGVTAGNAHRLGIMYVIWNGRTWSSYTGVWKTYTGANPHTDHIHISFSWDGAMKRTSWWSGQTMTGTDYGPCQAYVGEPVPPYTTRNPSPCPEPSPLNPSVATPLRGDWDGDGIDDVGWFLDGAFFLRAADGSTTGIGFGRAGDVPVVGDWDGDGDDTIGIFRTGKWHLRNENSPGPAWRSFSFGRGDDIPLVGVWNVNAGTGVGVFRTGTWHLRSGVLAGSVTAARYGRGDDVPVVGDWDGNGSSTPGVRRAGQWFLAGSSAKPVAYTSFTFGNAAMRGLPGDWTGDGVTTAGVVKGAEFHLAAANVSGSRASVVRYGG